MLFKEIHLKSIKSGEITLAFRKWHKASVKIGSLMHTSVGLIKISDIQVVNEIDITDQDAALAGYNDTLQLLKSFGPNNRGNIYKITVCYHSADPRIKLREQTDLSENQFNELKNKVDKLNRFSKQGNWTNKILLAIKDNPNLHAIGIAKLTGFEKEWLKLNIRKLKNLGLTISQPVGYEISPLGNEYLNRLGL